MKVEIESLIECETENIVKDEFASRSEGYAKICFDLALLDALVKSVKKSEKELKNDIMDKNHINDMESCIELKENLKEVAEVAIEMAAKCAKYTQSKHFIEYPYTADEYEQMKSESNVRAIFED